MGFELTHVPLLPFPKGEEGEARGQVIFKESYTSKEKTKSRKQFTLCLKFFIIPTLLLVEGRREK